MQYFLYKKRITLKETGTQTYSSVKQHFRRPCKLLVESTLMKVSQSGKSTHCNTHMQTGNLKLLSQISKPYTTLNELLMIDSLIW